MSTQSTSAAATVGAQVFRTMQTSQGRDSVTGRQEQAAISEAQNLTRSWSDRLVQDYGWSRESADDYARRAYSGAQVTGDANLKLSAAPEVLGIGGGLTAGVGGSLNSGSDNSRTSRSGQSESQRIANGLEFLNTEGRSSAATQSRESFFRATSTSSDADIRGMTARHDASVTEARSHSIEAGRLTEAGQRYEQQRSYADTHGFQISRDLSQNWQAFASGELARNPGLKASGYETCTASWARSTISASRISRGQLLHRPRASPLGGQDRWVVSRRKPRAFGWEPTNAMRRPLGWPATAWLVPMGGSITISAMQAPCGATSIATGTILKVLSMRGRGRGICGRCPSLKHLSAA
jgi:hypothetical protein